MTYERIPFPTGTSNKQLYDWQISTARELKRIMQDLTGGDETDISALVSDIATLRTDVDALMSAVGDGWTPQRIFEHSLITATDEVLGSMANLHERARTQMQQDADASILASIDAHRANTGLTTEIRVRQEETNALAEQITSIFASLGVTNANVTVLTSAVANGDAALATQITSLQSAVAGNTASVVVLAESVDGIAGRYSIRLNNNNEVVGYAQLDGTPQGSSFIVAVDAFKVAKVGAAGGAAVPVFAISTVSGTAKLALRGDMLADGTIAARAIAANAVTADKISVGSLSAITANIGTVTAGLIRDAALIYYWDVTNGKQGCYDGSMVLDWKNKRFTMG